MEQVKYVLIYNKAGADLSKFVKQLSTNVETYFSAHVPKDTISHKTNARLKTAVVPEPIEEIAKNMILTANPTFVLDKRDMHAALIDIIPDIASIWNRGSFNSDYLKSQVSHIFEEPAPIGVVYVIIGPFGNILDTKTLIETSLILGNTCDIDVHAIVIYDKSDTDIHRFSDYDMIINIANLESEAKLCRTAVYVGETVIDWIDS